MDRPMNNEARNHPDVHLNLNARGLQKSPTLVINERCRQMRDEGRHVYRLGIGQSPFPVPESVVEKLRPMPTRRTTSRSRDCPPCARRSPATTSDARASTGPLRTSWWGRGRRS
jgi:hypothetical protein